MSQLRIGLVVVSLALSVLIGLAVGRGKEPLGRGGAAGEAGTARPPVIGLSMDTLKEARWQTDRDLFVARVAELVPGAEVIVQSAGSDDLQQRKDVEVLLARRVDVLVVIPHDGGAMAEAVRLAHRAGVPVVSYDRLITGCDLDLYVTFDNVRVGEAQARWLVDHLPTPGKGKIVRIYGAPTDNNAKLFKAGQDNVLSPYLANGDLEVLHEDWATDWQPRAAKDITNAAISRFGTRFDAVLASNDGTAGGAIQALSEAKVAGKVLVTGQDADLAACQRIAEGTQAMTVYKPIKALARKAAELAVDLARRRPVVARDAIANGERDVPSVLLPIVSVDRTNLKETVVADGFQPAAEVFRNVPAERGPVAR